MSRLNYMESSYRLSCIRVYRMAHASWSNASSTAHSSNTSHHHNSKLNSTTPKPISKNGSTIYLTRSRCLLFGSHFQACRYRIHSLGQAHSRNQCRANRSGHVSFAPYQAIFRYVSHLHLHLHFRSRLTNQLRRSSDLPFPEMKLLLLLGTSPCPHPSDIKLIMVEGDT